MDEKLTLWLRYSEDFTSNEGVVTDFYLIPDSEELNFRRRIDEDYSRCGDNYSVTYLDKARIFKSDIPALFKCISKFKVFYGL